MQQLILASSSQSRARVLRETKIPIQIIAPHIDETYNDSSPLEYVKRLSVEKAQRGWELFEPPKLTDEPIDFYIIGADQVAVFDDKIYGKPHTPEKARQFLRTFSGQHCEYVSGITVFYPKEGAIVTDAVITKLSFRQLSDDLIDRYVDTDKPLHCAGALKVESLGTSLLTSYSCCDPTAITGLPLLKLNQLLGRLNITMLDFCEQKVPSHSQ